MHTLFCAKGWGSVIAEAGFVFAGVSYRREEVDPEAGGPGFDRLKALNPLGQFPTVLLPDGQVLTESAAILLHLADRAPPGAGLAPGPLAANRPEFLRWLVFLVSTIYPTFTFGDFPSRYVEGEAAQTQLRDAAITLRKAHFRQLEQAARAPWFLGEERSAIDIYIWAMQHWRPGPAWFAEHCPKLTAIATAVDGDPRLAELRAWNFAR
jgi:GST-like protein